MAINRRHVLGMGAAAAAAGAAVMTAGTAFGQDGEVDDDSFVPTTPRQACDKIARSYQREVRKAGGTWSSHISVHDRDGTPLPAASVNADAVVQAYSVNKIAIAVAVLDKIDRGLLNLGDQVEVDEPITQPPDDDGIIGLDSAYPSRITLGHMLALLLTVSDNVCVRLSARVCPADELNQILRGKGFPNTQVKKSTTRPGRITLGLTTPNETHTLLQKLVRGELLSDKSTKFLLRVLRSTNAFNEGIRHNLTTAERTRVATKAGWFATGRNEAGIMFDAAGKPMVTYALFATGPYKGNAAVNADNYAASHPAIRARATLGQAMFTSFAEFSCEGLRSFEAPGYRASEGD